jgi:hypothetical protein
MIPASRPADLQYSRLDKGNPVPGFMKEAFSGGMNKVLARVVSTFCGGGGRAVVWRVVLVGLVDGSSLSCQVVCYSYTDVVVKLSATLEDIAKNNLICNVHGVRWLPAVVDAFPAAGGP